MVQVVWATGAFPIYGLPLCRNESIRRSRQLKGVKALLLESPNCLEVGPDEVSSRKQHPCLALATNTDAAARVGAPTAPAKMPPMRSLMSSAGRQSTGVQAISLDMRSGQGHIEPDSPCHIPTWSHSAPTSATSSSLSGWSPVSRQADWERGKNAPAALLAWNELPTQLPRRDARAARNATAWALSRDSGLSSPDAATRPSQACSGSSIGPMIG